MERFIELGKKKMAGGLSIQEEAELSRLLESRPDLKRLYDLVIAGPITNSEQDILDAEKAYAVHFVKMHLKNQFDT
jgi:hypothetical protein